MIFRWDGPKNRPHPRRGCGSRIIQKQLPDAIHTNYKFIPAKVEVEEHHIGIYSNKSDEHMVKASHPKSLLHGSLVSSTLAAAIINGKYVNAVPLYRLEQEFARYGLRINRQNMANWMIRIDEEYLLSSIIICIKSCMIIM